MRQIGYEFRKLWTQTAKVCILAILILLSLFTVLTLPGNSDSITGNGTVLHGIKGIRAVAEESGRLEGTLDQAYLDRLKRSYEKSEEKRVLGEEVLPMYYHKYAINSFLNCARKGPSYTTNWDLSLSWLRTEEDFYQRYRAAMLKDCKEENERGWGGTSFQYTQPQLRKLQKAYEKMKTPFYVAATNQEGINQFKWHFCQYYWIALAALVFCLGGVFSKDSHSGLDELFLASRHGRGRAMRAKLAAGNLFATMIYFIYAAVMAGLHQATLSLSGLGSSIQLLWPSCVYDLSIGGGLFVLFLMGWLVTLLIANLAMLLSARLRYLSLSVLAAVLLVGGLKWLTRTTQMSRLIGNPLYFVTHFSSSFDSFYFLGGKMVSYTACTAVLAAAAILVVIPLTTRCYKTYRIH